MIVCLFYGWLAGMLTCVAILAVIEKGESDE